MRKIDKNVGFIGAAWGFVDWGIAGVIFAWLYNKINN